MSDSGSVLFGTKWERNQGCLTVVGFIFAFIAAMAQTIVFFGFIDSVGENPESWLLVIPAPILWIGIVLAWKKPIYGGLIFLVVSLFIFLSPQISPELTKADLAGVFWLLIWCTVILPLLVSGIFFLILGIRQRLSLKKEKIK